MGEPLGSIPVSDLDLESAEFVADPFPAYAALRATGKVVFHEKIKQYLIPRYRECAQVLIDADHFASDERLIADTFGAPTILAMDNPRHDEVRSVWREPFSRDHVSEQTTAVSGIVEECVGAFVRRINAGETVNLLESSIRDIPTLVIGNMLGVPEADLRQFAAWSDAMSGVLFGKMHKTSQAMAALERGQIATVALNEYAREQIETRRAATGCPAHDLISKMVASPVAATMTEQEIVASNTQLVFAGTGTTARLMAHTMVALANHPDQRAMILQDRDLVPQAIDEVLRFGGSTQVLNRIVRGSGVNVGGVELEDGTPVLCLLASANRDSRWERGESFDVMRPYKSSLSFGFGVHSCLGVNLARFVTKMWLECLLDQLPNWRLNGPVNWGFQWTSRVPASVPISR
jgi:cytochrome P450